MFYITCTLFRRLDMEMQRRIVAVVLLSFSATFVDILLLVGVLGFARLLIDDQPFSLGPLWLTLPLHQRTSPELAIIAVTGSLLALSLIKALFQGWSVLIRRRILVPLVHGSMRSLFAQQLAQSSHNLNERTLAGATATLVEDFRSAVQHVAIPALDVIPDLILALAIVIFLLVVNPISTLALVLTFLGGAGAEMISTRRLRARQKQAAREVIPYLIEITTQALSAMKEIKVMRRELEFRRRMRQVAMRYARSLGDEGIANALPRIWNENILFLCLFVLSIATILSGQRLEQVIPSLAVFSAAGWRLLPLTNRLLRATAQMRVHLPTARHLVSRWTPPQSGTKPAGAFSPLKAPIFVHTIHFRNLSCGHHSESPVVTGLNATIRSGETVAITGRSGIGKTTLLDTLLGLIEPLAGGIEIDDRPLSSVRLHWQRQIGYVPQDPYVANDTVRNNIAWGLLPGHVSDTRIREVLTDVGLAEVVFGHLPRGLDTRLGERGTRLSGGQRQRLCIARALLTRPALLVMDETTSQLDVTAEADLLGQLRRSSPDLTVILVTHRSQTAQLCNQIIDLTGPVGVV